MAGVEESQENADIMQAHNQGGKVSNIPPNSENRIKIVRLINF